MESHRHGVEALKFTNWIIIWYNVSHTCPAELLSASPLNAFKTPYNDPFEKCL